MSATLQQVVNPVLLPVLRQEEDVIFQQGNARPHTSAVMQPALHGVQQLPWLTRVPDLLPTEQVWDMMKWELTLSPEPVTTIVELRQWVQEAWDNLLQDDIRLLDDRLHARIHAYVATRGEYTV